MSTLHPFSNKPSLMHVILSQSARVVNGQNQRFGRLFTPGLRQ